MFTLAQVLFVPLLFIAGALAVSLEWPNYPEHGQNFSLRWSAGTPPYVVYVLESNLQDHYYKYQGSDLITYWKFDVAAGTQVYFQVIDSTSVNATSPTTIVIGSPAITYPPDPPSGVSSSISWTGGWSPYTVYVLSADLQRSYWKYKGANTSVSWDCDLDPGTRIIFQVVDNQNITVTGPPATVARGPAATTRLSSTTNPSQTGTPGKSNHTGAIAGGVLGGSLVLGVIAGTAYFVHRKHSLRPTYVTAGAVEMPTAEMATRDQFLITGESHFIPSHAGRSPSPPRAEYVGLPEV